MVTRSCVASGTVTLDGTEQTLHDETTAGNIGKTYDAAIDLTNLIATDTVEIWLYLKLLTGGSAAKVYYAKYVGAQGTDADFKLPVVYVPAMTVPFEWKLTVKGTKTAGSYKTCAWTVYGD